MASLFFNPQGQFQVAGNPAGTSGQGPDLFASTLTPGYTGTQPSNAFSNINLEGLTPEKRAEYQLLGNLYQDLSTQRAQERQYALQDWELARQQRKQEAQEAFGMKSIAAIPGQIADMFKTYAQLSYPAAAIEIASRTPALLANVYGSNPYAGRKWLS